MKHIKNLLTNSTTMPLGTGLNAGGSLSGLPVSGVHAHSHHHHHEDGSCCSCSSHDHSHEEHDESGS